MDRRSPPPFVVPAGGQCTSCRRDRRNSCPKVSNKKEKKKQVIKNSGGSKPSRATKPLRSPIVDTTFTVDHIPFITKRSKMAMEKPYPFANETRSLRIPEVVDLTTDDQTEKIPWQIHANHEFETGVPSARRRSVLAGKEPAAVVNIGKLVSMTVQDIPKSMNLVFRPTDDMNLSGVELVVATYIFMRHLPESEILIDIGDCYATRGALMTLAPKMEVVDDVSTNSLTRCPVL
ncbi:uncharacterized protein LOC107619197 isoform X2 [Arachis ipaensis]|uniref:uncharacterized protein LOC107619197 isoform X2 n=1 Tax=Arachis ipaensis TaxID=130454 RepID=UPI0007AF3864|nr:uncharacterized protein LOC107619197 isoform X2 [Arachis ipaensis]